MNHRVALLLEWVVRGADDHTGTAGSECVKITEDRRANRPRLAGRGVSAGAPVIAAGRASDDNEGIQQSTTDKSSP